jgi:hypothetical protein
MLVVELDGPTMMAWIGVMRALNQARFASLEGPEKSIIGERES